MWNNALGRGNAPVRIADERFKAVFNKKPVNRVLLLRIFAVVSLVAVFLILASLSCTRQTLLMPAANRYRHSLSLQENSSSAHSIKNQDHFHRKVWLGKMIEYRNSRNKNNVLFFRRGFRRVARFFGAGKKMPNIKELGLYALLSYGFVSNASYAICVGLAWFASSKKTGVICWDLFFVCLLGIFFLGLFSV